ncbi:bifunctional tetrahydrofolate synthase/dihydrofolate synthase [Thalassotalea sp. LPB0316]|uniref:bifunctional tetrahydrofolate synthase/dihydrofolate synthase n=1 Tax=Thalassotalea sp. LPB0316 TaxID=2769490 RepID=UPI001868FC43|nr:bifunctional tetrahydrofolate synthase/dihydrofolate synthase [Thalassotalea sp. LPB0316]QOL25277.1 bifunctional tetrahydrofolate synthase/dihydrofolate synthase [Thalassotalea sp. LPB0316]
MTKPLPSQLSNASLDNWLSYLESIHSQEIDLGLTRINQVAERLAISLGASTVITVAGTNGKGTTCAFLENALLAKGKRVAVYSSPHIERFNERLRIDKADIDDAPLIQAFERIEQARGDISLTYYEYTTLAALMICQEIEPDIVILEVGLGGRLDATNIIDADIAVITSIDLDHQAFLGNTKELIGFEKAGIMRGDKIAVVGEPRKIHSIVEHAASIGAKALYRGQDFNVEVNQQAWQYQTKACTFNHLTLPNIPLDNVATAITVLRHLELSLDEDFINQVISQTQVVGRTELVAQHPQVLLDVAHNPHAARHLVAALSRYQFNQLHCVVGMLKDKDIQGTLSLFEEHIAHWYLTNLAVPRGAQARELAATLSDRAQNVNCFDNVEQAFKMALQTAEDNDLILVFGSFFTVAEVRKLYV